jgi:hypothetical protein
VKLFFDVGGGLPLPLRPRLATFELPAGYSIEVGFQIFCCDTIGENIRFGSFLGMDEI